MGRGKWIKVSDWTIYKVMGGQIFKAMMLSVQLCKFIFCDMKRRKSETLNKESGHFKIMLKAEGSR